jgi:DnaK suppressor protein
MPSKKPAAKSKTTRPTTAKQAAPKARKPVAAARPTKPSKPARKATPVAKPARDTVPMKSKTASVSAHSSKAASKPVAKATAKTPAAPAPAPTKAARPEVAAKPVAATKPVAAPAPAAGPQKPVAATKAPVRTAPPVVATAISRGTITVMPPDSSADGEDGDEASSLLAGPRNVKPYIAKRGEQYMNREQLEHFRNILQTWKRDLMVEVDRTVTHMKDEAANFPDPNDRATQEEEFSLELRTRDRERKLIRKIDEALKRIEDGSYGYCLETGEEIGIKRLEARPVATLSIEAQERRERRERQYGDRDDRYR